MGSYRLECQYPECDKVYEAHNEYRLCCDHELSGHHGAALLRAVYENKQIEVRDKLPGIFRYADWIPTGPFYIDPANPALGSPICFRSHELANRLGLKQLFRFAGLKQLFAHLSDNVFHGLFEFFHDLPAFLIGQYAGP